MQQLLEKVHGESPPSSTRARCRCKQFDELVLGRFEGRIRHIVDNGDFDRSITTGIALTLQFDAVIIRY
jgi:hypothetical protein